VTSAALPAPWTGGIRSTIGIDVYLPPGYDGGSARYPVIFEGPDAIATWQNGMRLPGVLDSLITSGAIPPEIVVFVSDFGGPYADSECANSFDGTEWIDRFMATDLVQWVDTSFRTLATPASRATFGFSLGGYCAAALLAHHPDVFNSAVVLSGYFVSGIHSGTTPNSWRPFNNDPAIIAATSPMTVVPRIPSTLGSRLFVTMTADPTQGFYGPQMAQFAAALHSAGASMAIIPSTLGHSWDSARQFVPTMLEELAGRMVTLGVFGPAA
jgi:enterochelin esterase-like enzyme